MAAIESDKRWMQSALKLAGSGQGHVEPNPMVGCVLVKNERVVGQGYHRRFGSEHAEIVALRDAGAEAAGSTAYVNLEPCCHHGKTPPCTTALIAAGVSRAVVSLADPFDQVSHRGLDQLRAAGLDVEVGVLESEARDLNAPYLKLVAKRRPWIIAKWAMTLDGKIATSSGDSRWVSSEASRRVAHQLRGRVDGILVGAGTAQTDDPLLTARPPGARTALRIVAGSNLSPSGQLIQTADSFPTMLAAGPSLDVELAAQLRERGCDVLMLPGHTREEQLAGLLDELGSRRFTNVLVEGGEQLLGSLFDLGEIDEVHVFIAPKLVGGAEAKSPIGGIGVPLMQAAGIVDNHAIVDLSGDLYLSGRLRARQESTGPGVEG